MTLRDALDQSPTHRAGRYQERSLMVIDAPPGCMPRLYIDGQIDDAYFAIAWDRLKQLDDWEPLDARPHAVCPDCRGSGRYVGLQAVEMCATCVGRGHVPAELAPTK